MNRSEVQAILSRFDGKRVLVVGDLMLDEHVWGQATRVSPEAPVLVVEAKQETYVPGGAANVAAQIVALGAEVVVGGIVGEDSTGGILRENLGKMGCATEAVIETPDRPTTRKTRIVAGTQQIVRVDREKRGGLPHAVESRLIAACETALESCHALLFSDYDKGVLSRELIHALTTAARRRGIPITANPKPPTIKHYGDIDVAQLNRVEADAATKSHRFEEGDDLTFHEAGGRLRAALGVQNLMVTRSAEGLTVFHADGTYTDFAPHRVEVYDGTGAGDSTIAGYTLALAAGANLRDAVAIGNAAGGAVVRKVGVVTATRDEISTLFAV
jgi:D-beta-D-heptose 7-phosphate kinase/D-beta-D-heptose 1-phosphate adenosyltransferase